MSCEDCIHYDICIFHIKGDENKKCKHFKIEANVVEVVRCKDCKHYGTSRCAVDTYAFDVVEEGFCSYGESKERDNDNNQT